MVFPPLQKGGAGGEFKNLLGLPWGKEKMGVGRCLGLQACLEASGLDGVFEEHGNGHGAHPAGDRRDPGGPF